LDFEQKMAVRIFLQKNVRNFLSVNFAVLSSPEFIEGSHEEWSGEFLRFELRGGKPKTFGKTFYGVAAKFSSRGPWLGA
jgi:hypothetical protein